MRGCWLGQGPSACIGRGGVLTLAQSPGWTVSDDDGVGVHGCMTARCVEASAGATGLRTSSSPREVVVPQQGELGRAYRAWLSPCRAALFPVEVASAWRHRPGLPPGRCR